MNFLDLNLSKLSHKQLYHDVDVTVMGKSAEFLASIIQRALLVRTTSLSQYQPCHGDVSPHSDAQCYLSLWNTWFSCGQVPCSPQLIPCKATVTKDEVYNWYACGKSTTQPWCHYSGRVAITVSKMSFSACEWGECPSNYIALSEFPAEVMHDVFHGNWTIVRPSSNFG